MSSYRRIVWPTLVGMALGFFVIQPINVLVFNLAPETQFTYKDIAFWTRWLDWATDSTSIFMGLAFSLFGGVTGLWLGLWRQQKDQFIAEQMESARRLAALETLQELMVTLAHYIRNANMVIGGFSNHLLRHLSDRKHQEKLELIHQASKDIEAVVNSLQSLTQISASKYISSGTAQMIDLKKELEEQLAANIHQDKKN